MDESSLKLDEPLCCADENTLKRMKFFDCGENGAQKSRDRENADVN